MTQSTMSPIKPEPASLLARYTCCAALVAVVYVWSKFALVPATSYPPAGELHDWRIPAFLTCMYLISLPSLRWVSQYIPNAKSMLQVSRIPFLFLNFVEPSCR